MSPTGLTVTSSLSLARRGIPGYGPTIGSSGRSGGGLTGRVSRSVCREVAPWRRQAQPSVRAQARDEVDEAHDLVLLEWLGGHRHRAVQIGGRLRLEPSEQPQQVVVVLSGQPRDLLVAGEARTVARRAVM